MTTYSWPNALCPSSMEWRINRSGAQFRSPFNAALQAIDFVGDWWSVAFAVPPNPTADGVDAELLLQSLAGGGNRLAVYHYTRPIPLGTMRGSPTVQTQAARGDAQLVLTVTSGATLKAGDFVKTGGQLFRVYSDCTAAATTLTVPLVNRVRATIASATAVIWDSPTIDMIMPEMSFGRVYVPNPGGALAEATQFALEEAP